jgi:diadenylate cyclase
VRNQRVVAGSCFLPLTLNPKLSKELGTRHRAAIGVTEDTDAVAVVVSEETGVISFVQSGEITRHLDNSRLRELIRTALEPPKRLSEVVLPAAKRGRKSRTATKETSREAISETFIK